MDPATVSVVLTITVIVMLIGLATIWGGFALWYQARGGTAAKLLSVVLWGAFALAILIALCHGRIALAVFTFGLAFAALLHWWARLQATNDRDWADDVAEMTTGTIDGNRVTLHKVRNFDWRSLTDYTQRWETRNYDLDQLLTVDMIMSYWSRPSIAHMLMSFGFLDGAHVVFSVEIRREKTQVFSEIGGFFKDFELSIIAADERDVVRLRTNIRGEDDYLYRLQLPVAAMRLLFLGYVDAANNLIDVPRFYHTVTVNCTTLVYDMMKRIVGRLPLDYRLLLSGYLPQYVYGIGGLDPRYSLEELRRCGRITDRAKLSDRSETFSADIRQGLPAGP